MLLAPHVFVEDVSVASIARAKTNFDRRISPRNWLTIIAMRRARFGDGMIFGFIRIFEGGIFRNIFREFAARFSRSRELRMSMERWRRCRRLRGRLGGWWRFCR